MVKKTPLILHLTFIASFVTLLIAGFPQPTDLHLGWKGYPTGLLMITGGILLFYLTTAIERWEIRLRPHGGTIWNWWCL
jgi:cytochrome c biogenesis protein CcdA